MKVSAESKAVTTRNRATRAKSMSSMFQHLFYIPMNGMDYPHFDEANRPYCRIRPKFDDHCTVFEGDVKKVESAVRGAMGHHRQPSDDGISRLAGSHR